MNDYRDPALDFATREKVVLKLAPDPVVQDKAFDASTVYLNFEALQQKLEEYKVFFREYAKKKRETWNGAYQDRVTTIKIPYELKTERGVEKRFIAVSCTASYTVDTLVIGKFKKEFPNEYKVLFTETVKETLKPGAKNVLRSQLKALGLPEDKIRSLFAHIFDVETEVKPVEGYEYIVEDTIKNQPPLCQKYLDLGVKRAVPSVTFETR